MTPEPTPLPRFPWRTVVKRIIAGTCGAGLMGVGSAHLLRDFFGPAVGANHSDWVSFAIIGVGVVLLLLALDFENQALAFLKGLPLPAWLKGAKGN